MNKAKTVFGYLLIAVAGFAAGCGSSAAAGPKGDSGTRVTVVHLDDGTRCAIMDSASGGVAIDCNWLVGFSCDDGESSSPTPEPSFTAQGRREALHAW